MYELFQGDSTSPIGGLAIPELRRVRAGLQESIEKVRRYRAINPLYLNNSNPLIRLLGSLDVPLSLDPATYVDRVEDLTYRSARAQFFTSSVSTGRVFEPGIFYGSSVSEMILISSEAFDLKDIESDWPNLRPISVISHPCTDLNLHVPDGTFSSAESGTAVIAINLPMLALQYKMWRRWERGAFKEESPRTIGQFLMAHPLPNMLYSHIDVAIFNRVFCAAFEIQPPVVRRRHPFYLIDWTTEIDAIIRTYLTAMRTRKAEVHAMIQHMPTVGYASRYDTLALPEMPFTYQTMPAIILARLRMVMFTVQMSHALGNPKDFTMLSYLNRFFRKMESMNVLASVLPAAVYEQTNLIIDQGIKPYLR